MRQIKIKQTFNFLWTLLVSQKKKIFTWAGDFKWAEIQSNKLKRGCFMYLQPEWSKSKIILPRIIDYVKSNSKWKISLQTQKYMNIP